MNEMKGTALSLAVLVVLGACTETQFADTLGVGKSAPDENQIRVNQALSMPPDLQLKAPTGEVTEYGTPNKAKPVANKTRAVSAAPDEVDEAAVDEPVMTASVDPVPPPQPVKTAEAAATATTTTTTTATTTTTPGEPPPPPTIDDAYARYGISKNYPNGKPKPVGVLNDELRKAEAAAKRANDPKYGTIWNMGDMFGSD